MSENEEKIVDESDGAFTDVVPSDEISDSHESDFENEDDCEYDDDFVDLDDESCSFVDIPDLSDDDGEFHIGNTAPVDVDFSNLDVIDSDDVMVKPAEVKQYDYYADDVFSYDNRRYVVTIGIAALVIAIFFVVSMVLGIGNSFQTIGPSTKVYDESNTMVLDSTSYCTTYSVDTNVSSKLIQSVKAPTSGTVEKVNVSVGDTVKEGDVLYVISDETLVTQLKDATDAATTAQNTLDNLNGLLDEQAKVVSAAQSSLSDANSTYKALTDANGSTTGSSTSLSGSTTSTTVRIPDSVITTAYNACTSAQKALDAANDAYDDINGRVTSAQSDLDAANKNKEDLQVAIDALTVKAAGDGIVTKLDMSEGKSDFAQDESVLEIYDIVDNSYVTINLNNSEAESISKRNDVKVTVGESTAIDADIAQIERGDATTSIKIALYDTPSEVRNGDKCHVDIILSEANHTVELPKSAVRVQSDGTAQIEFVYNYSSTRMYVVEFIGEASDGEGYLVKSMLFSKGSVIRTDFNDVD